MPCIKPGYESIEYQKLHFGAAVQKLYFTPLHWHEEIEILFGLDGSFYVVVDDSKYALDKGDLFLINSNQMHRTFAKKSYSTVLVFQLDIEYTKRYYNNFNNLKFNYFSRDFSDEDGGVNQVFRKNLSRFMYELNKKEPGYEFVLESCVNEIICNLLRNIDYTAYDHNYTVMENHLLYTSRLKNIIDSIESNYKDKLTLKEFADKNGLNLNYLSRYFKKMMKCSFQEFLNIYRLKRSIILLCETDKSISEIALDSGFADNRTYINIFKRIYGLSPSLWRKKYKKDNFDSSFFPFLDKIEIRDNHFLRNSHLIIDQPRKIFTLFRPYI